MRALLLLLFAPLLVGCGILQGWMPAGSSTGPKYDGSEPKAVWAATKDAFSADWRTATVNDTTHELESDWDVQLSPMYRKGRRRKAFVWMYDDDGAPDLEVQILREVNRDRERPMDPGSAVWEADGRDAEMERRLIRAVELRLGKAHERSAPGGRRPSPYREEETEAEKQKRLWGDK